MRIGLKGAILVAIVGFVAGAMFAFAASADQDTGKALFLKTGDYRNLTFMRKVKLGAAPYVNPKLLKTSAVIYRYDLESIASAMKSQKAEILAAKWEAGAIAPALYHPESGEYELRSVDSVDPKVIKAFDSSIHKKADLWLAEVLEGWVLVGHEKTLDGIKSAAPIVSWNAKFPVIEAPGSGKEASPAD